MANSVTLHDDYIEVVWHGGQTAETVRQSNLEVLAAAEKLKAQGKPVWVSLCMLEHPVMPNMGAFREDLKMFRVVDIERLVVCGELPSPVMTLVTSVIGSFQEIQIRHVKDPAKALVWLRSGEDGQAEE